MVGGVFGQEGTLELASQPTGGHALILCGLFYEPLKATVQPIVYVLNLAYILFTRGPYICIILSTVGQEDLGQ